MVKQWETKSEIKNGERISYLAWKHLRLSFDDILDLYVNQLSEMSEHSFFASWNYVQYKQCKNILQTGEVLMVQDFAQNYLCELQNQPQLHKQTTIHPTVVHYRSPTDDCCLVTHEVVHVSNDLKHDAHLVEKFQSVTMEVLKEHKVEIHKIIKFSDQAPSQYKNKTSFDYLSKVQKPTMHCFFGVWHGKGPCNACTGHVKQAVKQLIKSGTSTVDTAEAFYKAAKEHLTTEKFKPGKCVYFKQTFHFMHKIPNRPKANTFTAVPETHQLHAICNTGMHM